MNPTGNPSDVLVLGGGAAGLAAAQSLTRSGVKALLLEARDRLGGRILSERNPALPMPIEMGAEFVHGLAPETFSLAKKLKIAVVEIDGRHQTRVAGRIVEDAFWETIELTMGALRRWVAARPTEDMSFAAYCERVAMPAETRKAVTGFVEGFHASDAKQISVQALARLGEASKRLEEHRSFRLEGGFGAMIAGLARGLRKDGTRMSTRVERIEWGPTGVRVFAEGVEYEGKALIVTVPLGVLQSSAIEFVPPLTMKAEALAGLRMGAATRVVLRFEEAFWDEDVAMLHGPGLMFPTWWTAQPAKSPHLVAWAGGPAAEAVSGWSPEKLRQQALCDLAVLLSIAPEKLHASCREVRTYDWQHDPLVLGAYSYAAAGGVDAHSALAVPVPPLFFAGEATDGQGDNGTVNGALVSGRRAAGEVAQWLRELGA